MNNMPKSLRKECAEDPFYQRCCITGELGKRGDRIEWHHALIYAGRQYQAKFAILPVKQSIHKMASKPEIKERMDWVMVNRATDIELRQISKAKNYVLYRDFLNAKFGRYPHLTRNEERPAINYPWLCDESKYPVENSEPTFPHVIPRSEKSTPLDKFTKSI